MFGRLFGSNKSGEGKPSAARVDLNTSIQQLRQAATQLEKRETHLEKRIEACLTAAKAKSKKRDKKGAIMELKKKKQLENQLNALQGKKMNLETQIMTLEDAHLNAQTLTAMKTSAAAMKSTIADNELENAEDLMDDIQEAHERVQEMNEAMSQPMGLYDDAELEAELDELDQLEADELLESVQDPPMMNSKLNSKENESIKNVDDLPKVPNKKIEAKNKKQDDEDSQLAELEAMMN